MTNQRLTKFQNNTLQRCGIIFLLMCFGTTMARPVTAATMAGEQSDVFQLSNKHLAWRGQLIGGKLTNMLITHHGRREPLRLDTPYFRMVLGNGKTITSSDFVLARHPEVLPLQVNDASPKLADHFPGRKFAEYLVDQRAHLEVLWSLRLRDNANYIREQLVLRTTDKTLLIKNITLLHQRIAEAKTIGTVEGSPVVAGNFFTGYENPMAKNTVGKNGLVQCAFTPYAILKPGETYSGSCVIGVAPKGQLRRGFMAYLNMERCHPYRPFLHYNSWYDIDTGIYNRYTQTQCIHAINSIGKELVMKRKVDLKSFLFDDGWESYRRLWKFNSSFPDGFTPLWKAAAKYHAGVGIWLSPFGGYGKTKDAMLRYGKRHGFEINKYGFNMAGPRYYHRFSDICRQMIQKYHVNIFKFDGLAAGGGQSEHPVLMREGDAMLQLDSDLRKLEPDLYISQTTGTWASPFWLLWVDSIWRGGADHAFYGTGSWCQQWITYRDWQTYENIVLNGPLFPLNSVMLHGIILARSKYCIHLRTMSNQDFADQVWSFFGTGTQLQELYITPHLLNHYDWDVLARAAKWANNNAAILSDTHWIGGNPARGQVYGWASWHNNKGIFVLRNPTAHSAQINLDIGKAFQLPAGAATRYRFHTPRKHAPASGTIVLTAGKPHIFKLKGFEVLVLESGQPAGRQATTR